MKSRGSPAFCFLATLREMPVGVESANNHEGESAVKNVIGILLGAMLLVACNPGGDKKPVMEQERAALSQAKQVDSTLQRQAQQQQQEADKQAQ